MSGISLICGFLTGRFAYKKRGQTTMLWLALSVFAMVYFMLYASGQLFWARWVPASAAIIYTNLAALFAACGAGWAWRLPDTPVWRRGIMAGMLAVASAASIIWPLLSIALRPPPAGDDQWRDGVALQTSWATCSPAAAATFLNAEEIKSSEAELIPLCLTDSSGTPTLGLYRGVKLVANENGKDVAILTTDLEGLIAADKWPVLIGVQLPFGTEDRRYAEQWGWIPGMGHSVVVLGRDGNDRFIVGDPSIGLEVWDRSDMEILWHGIGMRLVPAKR
ncbi:cysteine peptidase family C39 domain-containing protein [Roseimaritima multifibrata]|nr:peptidase C39 [Roseimaritima multifibrata]